MYLLSALMLISSCDVIMKSRVKKILCFILILSVVVFVPYSASGVEVTKYNGELIMYTVVNDTLLELTYNSMPVVKNGIVYVPYTLFTNNFDIRTVYDSSSRALMYGNFGKTLIFDMKNEVTYDTSMNAITQTGIYVKNQPFVPAKFVAEYFGLNYSFVDDGPIVRIYNNSASYPDGFLTTTFKIRMAEMKTSLLDDSSTDEPYVPPANNNEDDEPINVTRKIDVYTAFTIGSRDQTEAVLDVLDSEKMRSTFFVKLSDIVEFDDLIRRIWFEGHTIGFIADAEDSGFLQDIEKANVLLKNILKVKTNLILLVSTEDSVTSDIIRTDTEECGYRYWQPSIMRIGDDRAKKNLILDELLNGENAKLLLFDYSENTISELEDILDIVKNGNFNIGQIDLYTSPVNSFDGD